MTSISLGIAVKTPRNADLTHFDEKTYKASALMRNACSAILERLKGILLMTLIQLIT